MDETNPGTDILPSEPPIPKAHSPEPEPRLYDADPDHKHRSKNGEYQARTRLRSQFRLNDLENVPALPLDEEGYAIKPPSVSAARKKNFTEMERKVHFVLMFNHSAGNIGLSCQYAGCLRADFLSWKAADALFVKRLNEAQQAIADRAQFRLAQRIGLVRMPAGIDVHDTALFAYVKQFCNNLPEEVSSPVNSDGKRTQESGTNVPRPAR